MGRSRDWCIRWGAGRRRGRDSFGCKCGHAIVTSGTLMHSCAEVREAIELSFVMVSGVGLGIHVLEGKGKLWGFSVPLI